MKKHAFAVLGAAALIGMGFTSAQATGTTTDGAASSTSATAGATATMERTEAGKLIGQSVTTPSGERIGEVEAVNIGPDGRVSNVIIGVGGFLGIGERDVALRWQDLQIADGGSKVVANVTKERLEGMESYRYPDPKFRGTVFDGDGSR